MHLLYPSDSLSPKTPEEQYLPELEAARAAGFSTCLISTDYLQLGEKKIFPALPVGETVLYRGWMLDTEHYATLAKFVDEAGCHLHTDLEQYLSCHHLPNWYPQLADLTIKTVVFPTDVDLVDEVKFLGWPGYFLKDYVKSLKTAAGSRITSFDQLPQVTADLAKFRGRIEGGYCVRQLVDIVPDSERRYFVFHQKAHSPCGEVPPLVLEVASRIGSPFFSVDTATLTDGR